MMEKPQLISKFRGPFKGELGDELTGEVKIIWSYRPFSAAS